MDKYGSHVAALSLLKISSFKLDDTRKYLETISDSICKTHD